MDYFPSVAIMGQGSLPLSAVEKAVIRVLGKEDLSLSKIVERVCRSRNAFQNILRLLASPSVNKKPSGCGKIHLLPSVRSGVISLKTQPIRV